MSWFQDVKECKGAPRAGKSVEHGWLTVDCMPCLICLGTGGVADGCRCRLPQSAEGVGCVCLEAPCLRACSVEDGSPELKIRCRRSEEPGESHSDGDRRDVESRVGIGAGGAVWLMKWVERCGRVACSVGRDRAALDCREVWRLTEVVVQLLRELSVTTDYVSVAALEALGAEADE